MLASKHFKVHRSTDDDWFDPILDADTQLFLDPFLIFKEQQGVSLWGDAHSRIIGHFSRAFQLIAEGNLRPDSLSYKKAIALLVFKEPKELCLGYTSLGTAGAGSGNGYAVTIAAAISNAIQRGLTNPRHFEELGILNEGIGADRISDITCTVLKDQLVKYTAGVATKHGLTLEPHRIFGAAFDERRQRWETPEVLVPTNPHTGGPLLFVPARFLRDLPTLNADDWWNYYENERIREDINYEIMGHVNKATIVEIATRHPEAVRRWTIEKEANPADAYDFERDPKGVWEWDLKAENFVAANPLILQPPQTEEQFLSVIENVISQYRLFVEEQGGWTLLWDRGSEKPEHAAQLLFRGIAQHYCRANNISLDAEVNLGRGPVDFKFSNGFMRRAHLEVKKLHNGKFWNGLEHQLPSYMKSDEVVNGWFLAVVYRDNKSGKERLNKLPARAGTISATNRINVRFGTIDATPKTSASKL